MLVNPANVRYTEATTRSLQNAAHVIGVDIAFFNASTPAEIDSAFTVIAHEPSRCSFHCSRSLFRQRQETAAPRDFRPTYVGRGSWSCENSSALRERRNISVKLGIMRTHHAADIRLDAPLENCIFYISPMYEFSHSLGQKLKGSKRANVVRFAPESRHCSARLARQKSATLGHSRRRCSRAVQEAIPVSMSRGKELNRF